MTSIQHDHVVLLVDRPFFENLPDWITKNFTVTIGGKHEGQASRNKLIIFADGSYLELFNWYDKPPSLQDEHLPMRFWRSKTPGLIDFAITDPNQSAEESIFTVNERLTSGTYQDSGLGVNFDKPIEGSRKTTIFSGGSKVGREIIWKVTRPDYSDGPNTPNDEMFAHGRMDVPFFCHDITPRIDRVPCEEKKTTDHPCGALGIAACEILVPKHLLTAYARVYAKILGSNAEPAANPLQNSYILDIGVPQGSKRSTVVVRAAETEADLKRLQERGIGIFGLVIATNVDGPEGKSKWSLGATGIASTIWLENPNNDANRSPAIAEILERIKK